MSRLHLVSDRHDDRSRHRRQGVLGLPVVYQAHHHELVSGPEVDNLRRHNAWYGPGSTGGEVGTVVGHHPDRGADLVGELDAVALAGRGGAHFGVARKWRSMAAGDGGVVVANGAEGEPASAKDAALLQHRPHLVLDGLAAAATAVGATRTVVWLHEAATATHAALARAITERRSAGIRGPGVELATGPDAYLSGESSAVVRALSGGPALPTFRRVPATVSGIGGAPTLVHNVETLARVALVARNGRAGYRDTTLVTVVGQGRRTVLEVDPTTTVEQAVADAAAGAAVAPQAVLLGGYGGTWLPWTAAAHLPLHHQSLRDAGAGLGAGVVVPLPADACGIVETAGVLDYLARSSARQCGPCLFGVRAIADQLLELAQGVGGRGNLRRLRRFAAEVEGRGGCHHPDGAVRLLLTAMTTFEADLTAHAHRGRCLHRDDPFAAAVVLPVPAPAGSR
jgi:NADH:ubiquinone oxidoreductase subunit F (NADH-binding)